MDITLLIAFGSVTLVVIIAVGYFFRPKHEPKVQENRQRPLPHRIRDGAPRRAQMVRNRGARLRANAAHQQEQLTDDENEPVDDDDKIEFPDGKIGAKKRAKLEAKAEKKAQREVEEQMRSDKKKRDQQAADDRKKVEEREQAEAKQREVEERKAREEKAKAEHDEYLKMKEAFSVEEEGYEEGDDDENQLQEFVGFIKRQKVVVIEDLAARFKLKTQAAIDRIKDLQNDDILTGVIDDRGKFIYVSHEEMEAVAKFIKQRGRVSIAELAENSNQLVNMTPTTTAVK